VTPESSGSVPTWARRLEGSEKCAYQNPDSGHVTDALGWWSGHFSVACEQLRRSPRWIWVGEKELSRDVRLDFLLGVSMSDCEFLSSAPTPFRQIPGIQNGSCRPESSLVVGGRRVGIGVRLCRLGAVWMVRVRIGIASCSIGEGG